jgi:predicted transcriptional regulator
MKKAILEALEARYNAQISEADATIKIYLENSVGIGEHPQHIEEIDKQIQKIADAQEKLRVIEDFQPERSVL